MNPQTTRAVIAEWVAERLPRDVAQSIERLAHAPDVRCVAVMPDVHLSHNVCTGTVVASKELIYPHAVGSDIGCDMAALRFECESALLSDEKSAAQLLAALYQAVPANRHSKATSPERLPSDLQDVELSHPKLAKLRGRDGRVQLGTLGRGNHFIEFQADLEDRLWLMIHSGSRAMGQAINELHLAHAPAGDARLPSLHAESDAGLAYLADVDWACRYADHSRRRMADAVVEVMEKLFGVSPGPESFISCNHNHVTRETHWGEDFWVHRKGAISAREGEPGIIPGSMGTASFHVAGRGNEASLRSSSHGAGRRMSRSQAFGSIPGRELHRQMANVWFDHRLAGRLRDEAPSAYKDVHAVMHAQRDLTRIVRQLRPLLSYKGGVRRFAEGGAVGRTKPAKGKNRASSASRSWDGTTCQMLICCWRKNAVFILLTWGVCTQHNSN